MNITTREAIYLAVHNIPAGKVSTYGDVAKTAGLGRNARLVGRLLSQLPHDTKIPWHRVINAQGKLSFPENSEAFVKQKKRLADEGVEFRGNRIPLSLYRAY